jgi:hypothetical protein
MCRWESVRQEEVAFRDELTDANTSKSPFPLEKLSELK